MDPQNNKAWPPAGFHRRGSNPHAEEVLLPSTSHCTANTQTDYRDSEVQTEPYNPSFVVCPGSPPEILTLATLTLGHGLLIGLREVERVEWVRRQRAQEATLPPYDDLTQVARRERMMKEMEREKWAFREKEIQKLHDFRLDQLIKHLWQREERIQEVTMKRLDKRFSQRQRDRDREIEKMRRDYLASIRRLTEYQRNAGGKVDTRDTVKVYAKHTLRTCDPCLQEGQSSDLASRINEVKTKYLSTYEDLLQLEASLPSSVTEPLIEAPRPKDFKGFIKRADRHEMKLMQAHQELKGAEMFEEKPLRFLIDLEKPRPPTPVTDAPPEGDEEKQLALIFMQKLLRGRSIMNMMFEGKEKRWELIQELRTTHALQREEQEKQKVQRQVTLDLQKQRELHNHMVSMRESYLQGLAGRVVVDTLDFV
ncbi:cilia- and flagella-associated protein 91-like [Megalops cyprinoides]|uniref:cilia- and flagella-associated protein 91-like n=1 Tax=Megalops cyprinoides TaxID=118141 RepID=UPI001864C14E|nr:cilia- and flagella-associated protein 91-like [Megalops cyprinoides]